MKEMYVFYNKHMQVASNNSYSPSAQKPKLVVQSWKNLGYPVVIKKIKQLSVDEICLAHDPNYVKGIINNKINNGFGNKLASVSNSLAWTTGSFVSAALYSFHEKENSFSPTSGFHHACYAHGSGFCTFSGLTIAAIILRKYHKAKKIGILDLDSHPGDGTENTIYKTNSQDFIFHYSLGYHNIQREDNEKWLANLPKLIREYFHDIDILFFQAGMDCHENDPEVTTGFFNNDQIYRRDCLVYETCKNIGIPVVTNLAGGYQKPIRKIIDLHNLTAKAFQDVFS